MRLYYSELKYIYSIGLYLKNTTFVRLYMGVGMLLGIVLIMIGVYRGMIADANVILDDLDVDLWVVQENTLGPFAEASRIHEDLKYTLKGYQSIDKAEAITFQNLQIP